MAHTMLDMRHNGTTRRPFDTAYRAAWKVGHNHEWCRIYATLRANGRPAGMAYEAANVALGVPRVEN